MSQPTLEVNPNRTPLDGRLAVSVPEAAAALNVGISTIWSLLAKRKLACTRIGRRTVITVAELQRTLRDGA
jgi:excisionase family DNA binding protein